MGYNPAMSNLWTVGWHAYNTEFRIRRVRFKPVFSDDGQANGLAVVGYRQ